MHYALPCAEERGGALVHANRKRVELYHISKCSLHNEKHFINSLKDVWMGVPKVKQVRQGNGMQK